MTGQARLLALASMAIEKELKSVRQSNEERKEDGFCVQIIRIFGE